MTDTGGGRRRFRPRGALRPGETRVGRLLARVVERLGMLVAGRVLAPLLVIGGVLVVIAGDAGAGLALILAGWLARSARRARRRGDHLRGLLDGLTVGDVMETGRFDVAPQATLDGFAPELGASVGTGTGPDDRGGGSWGATVARVMADGRLVGLLGPREVARVPRSRWTTVRAGDAMVAAAKLPVLAPGDPVGPAAERLGADGAPGFPVMDDGHLAGVLTRLAVGRTLHQRAADAPPAGGHRD